MGQFFWNFMASHFFKLCQTAKCFRNKIYNEIVPFLFLCHKNFEVFQFLFTEKNLESFSIFCVFHKKFPFFFRYRVAQSTFQKLTYLVVWTKTFFHTLYLKWDSFFVLLYSKMSLKLHFLRESNFLWIMDVYASNIHKGLEKYGKIL